MPTEWANSATLTNLAAAFAGESQARNRYYFYADKAKNEGYFAIARLFEEIADNEKAHAQVFFDHVTTNMGNVPQLKVDADYPFAQGTTQENLGFALEGEHAEATLIYPGFATIARQEGLEPVARSFEWIASVEQSHHAVFSQLRDQLANGTLYKKDSPVVWRCAHCGYMVSSNEPWNICPVCQRPVGYVEPIVRFIG